MRMNRSASLLTEASRILFEEAALSTDATVVVGVSGGVDSMVLLHIAAKLGLMVQVVHVNYHQRGDASDADERLVRDVCARLGVPVWVADWRDDVAESGNFQDLARLFRRDRYQKVLHETGAEAILLGHNLDDARETLIMRVLRGSAPSNWSAMPAVSMPFVRPLVGISRSDILEYAADNGVEWREDASNQMSVYARNFLRNEFIPHLDRLFPGWKSNVDRIKTYGDVYRLSLDRLLEPYGDALSLPVDWLKDVPIPLATALVHRVHERHGLAVRATLPQQVIALLDHQPGRMVDIDGIVAWHRDRNRITIDLIQHDPFPAFSFSHNDIADTHIPFVYGDIQFGHAPGTSATFCMKASGGAYSLRQPESGDRIAIDHGTKPVSDLLNEWGVPRRLKPRTCVVTLDGSPVAVIFSHPGFETRWRVDPRQLCATGACICFNLYT